MKPLAESSTIECCWDNDRLGRYERVKGFEKVIKYYPDLSRYACVHAQARHGLIAAMCVFCAASLVKVNQNIRTEEGEEGEEGEVR